MSAAPGWDHGRSALRTLRQAETLLFKPAALAWFVGLGPRARYDDVWLGFERLLRTAMGEASAAQPRAAPEATVHPMAAAWTPASAATRNPPVAPSALPRPRNSSSAPHESARPLGPAPAFALFTSRADAVPLVRSTAAKSAIAARVDVTARSSATPSSEVQALRDVTPVSSRRDTPRTRSIVELAGRNAGANGPTGSVRPASVDPTATTASPLPSRIDPAETARADDAPIHARLGRRSSAIEPTAARGVDRPRFGDAPESRPADTFEPSPRQAPVRVVEGLPALKGLLQTALAESLARQAAGPSRLVETAALAVPAMTEPASALHAFAEEALIDKVIDRIDERMREQSVRHFGFTGGLTP